jgi:hypothetical protein
LQKKQLTSSITRSNLSISDTELFDSFANDIVTNKPVTSTVTDKNFLLTCEIPHINISSLYDPGDILSLSELKVAYFTNTISNKEYIDLYGDYVKQKDYIILRRLEEFKDPEAPTWIAIKVSKRGNDVYSYNVTKRFEPISDYCYENKDFTFIQKNARTGKTNVVYFTLTHGIKLCPTCKKYFPQGSNTCPICNGTDYEVTDRDTSIVNIGPSLNLFFSNVKKRYGPFKIVRCYEIFKSGYMHVHGIFIFEKTKFHCTRYLNKNNKIDYILQIPQRDTFNSYWHSYTKFTGVYSLGAIGYLLKYITKEAHTQNGYRTAAILSLFRKRSYAISKTFYETLVRLVETDIKRAESIIFTYLVHYTWFNSNYKDPEYEIFTTLRGVSFNHWSIPFKPPPDLCQSEIESSDLTMIELILIRDKLLP